MIYTEYLFASKENSIWICLAHLYIMWVNNIAVYLNYQLDILLLWLNDALHIVLIVKVTISLALSSDLNCKFGSNKPGFAVK